MGRKALTFVVFVEQDVIGRCRCVENASFHECIAERSCPRGQRLWHHSVCSGQAAKILNTPPTKWCPVGVRRALNGTKQRGFLLQGAPLGSMKHAIGHFQQRGPGRFLDGHMRVNLLRLTRRNLRLTRIRSIRFPLSCPSLRQHRLEVHLRDEEQHTSRCASVVPQEKGPQKKFSAGGLGTLCTEAITGL